jgi:hypothetical protein
MFVASSLSWSVTARFLLGGYNIPFTIVANRQVVPFAVPNVDDHAYLLRL